MCHLSRGDISWILSAIFGRNGPKFFVRVPETLSVNFRLRAQNFFINKNRDFWRISAIFGRIDLNFCMEVRWDHSKLSLFMVRVDISKLILILLAKNGFLGPNLGLKWAQSDQNRLGLPKYFKYL